MLILLIFFPPFFFSFDACASSNSVVSASSLMPILNPSAKVWPRDLPAAGMYTLPITQGASGSDSVTVYQPVSSSDSQDHTWNLSVGTSVSSQVQQHPVIYTGLPPAATSQSGWTTFSAVDGNPSPQQKPKHPQSLQQQQRAAIKSALEARNRALAAGPGPPVTAAVVASPVPSVRDMSERHNHLHPTPQQVYSIVPASPASSPRGNSKVVRSCFIACSKVKTIQSSSKVSDLM